MWGWIVAAVVVVAAGAFYFWPTLMQAPATTEEMTTTTSEQSGTPLQEQMAGNWRSDADAKFTREIRADAVMIDRYEGDASAGINGEWSVVNPAQESALAAMAAPLSGVSVIKVVWEGGAETTYFSVNALTQNSMTITDLSGRGGVTVFTKI